MSLLWALETEAVVTPDQIHAFINPTPLDSVPGRPFVVPRSDFIAGLADLAGELMRVGINHLGNDAATSHFTRLLQDLYAGVNVAVPRPMRSVQGFGRCQRTCSARRWATS